MKWKIIVWFVIWFQFSVQFFILLPFAKSENTLSSIDSYKNMRLWDEEVNNCFFNQDTLMSCVPASVQMVLKYLDYLPLPNQSQLAGDMHTNINSLTNWSYVYIPFQNRGFPAYYNSSLSDDFDTALSYLKGNVSQNFPAIVNTWYDAQARSENRYTHARVVTGYNTKGVFFHDPLTGPNNFLSYSDFQYLWRTGLGFWAFIIKQEPRFDLIVEARDWLRIPISGTSIILRGKNNLNGTTDQSGVVRFSNLTISGYILGYSSVFLQQEYSVTLTRTMTVSPFFLFSIPTIILILIVSSVVLIFVLLVWASRRRAYYF